MLTRSPVTAALATLIAAPTVALAALRSLAELTPLLSATAAAWCLWSSPPLLLLGGVDLSGRFVMSASFLFAPLRRGLRRLPCIAAGRGREGGGVEELLLISV